MITMKDIAKAAGVSQPVVSVVLNGTKNSRIGVSETNRHKVLAAAEKMGYEVDDMARGIKTGKTKVIGFLSSLSNRGASVKLIGTISQQAEKHGYMVKYISRKLWITCGVDKIKKVAQLCARHRLAALIVHGIVDDILLTLKDLMADQDTEIALVANYRNIGTSLHVTSNDAQGIGMIVDHLYELGHRKIAYISLPFIHSSSVIRRDAFIARTKDYNLEIPPEYIVAVNYQSVFAEIERLFHDRKKAPTALVCSGDNIAVRVKDILGKKYSISTPEDISITGFGDLECGRVCFPEITTVYEPFEEMGERIVEKLIAKLEGQDFGPTEEFIDTKLIIRDSARKIETKIQNKNK